ncbi:MAG: MgtC/SapB family protein [Oscillospiraceae bacterium]|nr:MgtC/SapB family protein [Oscillospiraceae bacterium]
MLHFLDPLRDLSFLSLVIRLLLACLCGTLVGLERSSKNRPAGFRTHILVCLGAAVAAITGTFLYEGLKMPADISRIGGQVITGLGFIGAGSIIITKKLTIKGLTTAAGLWTTGIVGLAIGSGYFELGIIGTALVLFAETQLGKLTGSIQKRPEFTLEILYNDKTALDQVLRYCKDSHMTITSLQIHTMDDDIGARYVAEVHLRGNRQPAILVNRIQLMPGVVAATDIET